jgi:hypothetical protein
MSLSSIAAQNSGPKLVINSRHCHNSLHCQQNTATQKTAYVWASAVRNHWWVCAWRTAVYPTKESNNCCKSSSWPNSVSAVLRRRSKETATFSLLMGLNKCLMNFKLCQIWLHWICSCRMWKSSTPIIWEWAIEAHNSSQKISKTLLLWGWTITTSETKVQPQSPKALKTSLDCG